MGEPVGAKHHEEPNDGLEEADGRGQRKLTLHEGGPVSIGVENLRHSVDRGVLQNEYLLKSGIQYVPDPQNENYDDYR